MAEVSSPIGRVTLEFSQGPEPWRSLPEQVEAMATSISAIAPSGRGLWIGTDQTATVELLTLDPDRPTTYHDHRSYRLGDLVPLPQGTDVEIDIEGVDLQSLTEHTGYLWLIGSHSQTRKNVKKKHSDDEAVEALARVELDQNRCMLIRVPFRVDDEGRPNLAATLRDSTGSPGTLTASALFNLREVIKGDIHLGRFLEIPGKDNGLDIEGLAVADDRIFVGLRGPVLRGWAVILELQIQHITEPDSSDQQLHLRARPGGGLFRKHFLDLQGLGVRELLVDGNDLVILAGPTMDLDGPVRLIRWQGGASPDGPHVVRAGDKLTLLHALPYGDGDDHAEAFTRLTGAGAPTLIVAYDSPQQSRIADGRVEADLFSW